MTKQKEIEKLSDGLYEYLLTRASSPYMAVAALLWTFYKIHAEYRRDGQTREDVINMFTVGLDMWDGRGGTN
jgi:hypothetical protein